MKSRKRELKIWIFHWIQVVANLYFQRANFEVASIGLGRIHEEKSLNRVWQKSFKTRLSFGVNGALVIRVFSINNQTSGYNKEKRVCRLEVPLTKTWSRQHLSILLGLYFFNFYLLLRAEYSLLTIPLSFCF